MKTKQFLKLLPVAALLFAGCQDDNINVVTDADNDTEIAGPAGKINFTVADFLDEIDSEYVKIREDGLVYLHYEQDVDLEWDNLVQFVEFSEEWTFSPSDALLASQLKAIRAGYTDTVVLSHRGDVRYDSSTVASGFMSAELSVPDGTVGDITISLPGVTRADGTPLIYDFYADGNQTSFPIYENLKDVEIDFKQKSQTPPYDSYFTVKTDFDLDNIGFGSATLSFNITNPQPGFTFGYYGQQEETKTGEELTFNIFEEFDALSEEIEFGDFMFDFEATSGIGVPFEVVVKNMAFYDSKKKYIDDLMVDGADSVIIDLDEAGYDNRVVEPTSVSFAVDRSNSNITDIGNKYPQKMIFDVISRSNPDGEESLNFMGPENILKGKVSGNIPLWFRTSSYTRQDTLSFDFNDMVGDKDEEARKVEKFDVYFDFYSKLPIDIFATAWVIDGNDQKIDDLFEEQVEVVQSGKPSTDGYVDEAKHTEFVVSLTGEQINQFLDREAKDIVMALKVATYEEELIKIYEDMEFTIEVSFDGAGQVPSL